MLSVKQNVKGKKFANKEIYSITEKGREYFMLLMDKYATESGAIPIDFNLVISNLNKVSFSQSSIYIEKLRENLITAQMKNDECIKQYKEIPLVGKTIMVQQNKSLKSLI